MNKWYGLCIIFILTFCSGVAWYLFPKAFPLIQIELTTSRTDILSKAKEQALLLAIGPAADIGCNAAVAFETDTTTQTFVELEGGGKQTFIEMITHHYYEPYVWHVRFFVPHQINESALYFTPQGTLYGFKEKISEDEVRSTISSDQAIAKALLCAKELVNGFENYHLIESSQHEQTSGRIDHTLVYERQDIQLNEGKYRLSITVAGDKVSECRQYIKIPESFERRYQEMRSYNNNLALLGLSLMIVLYILGACCIGLSLYTKEQLFCWKPALLCAGFIASINFLNQLNTLPLTLMQYDTVAGMKGYMLGLLLLMIFINLISFCFFSLVIVIAEGLTRKAFHNHIQLWQVWKQGCANSTAVGIRTLNGYVLTSVDLLLVIVTYLFTTHYFGWWNPSYALIDPNILATYVPALNSISLSLQAGFIEECLFRAIPLATAALLGDHFKKRTPFIIVGFILQAFIFGAAHANYPAQPFYARLVELTVPSCIWGIFYMRWGLLTIIICHVLYDIIWFSLPIFISHAAGIWIQQFIIIFCASIPLLIIWYQYVRTKQWHKNVSPFLNGSWQKPIKEKITIKKDEIHFIVYRNSVKYECVKYILMSGFLLCLLHKLELNTFSAALPSKDEVLAVAHREIASYTTANWQYIQSAKPLVSFGFESDNGHQFMWQNERLNYQTMLKQGYINFPGWTVRYAHFDGDILKRAEEAIVRINRDKNIMYIHHILPEHSGGADLTEREALALAADTVFQKYNFPANNLLLKSIIPSKKQQRTDWVIEYKVINDSVLKMGEARVQVVIVGNAIALVKKYIHVPEQCERQFKNDTYYVGLARNISLLVLLVCTLLLLSFMLTAIPLPPVSSKYALLFLTSMGGLMLLHFFNTLPLMISRFNTVEPWFLQLGATFGLFLISNIILVLSTTFLLTSTLYIQWPTAYISLATLTIWTLGLNKGITIGLSCITSMILLLHFMNGTALPFSYEHTIVFANSYAPLFYIVSTAVSGFLKFFAIGLLYLYTVKLLLSKKIYFTILLMGTIFGLPLFIAPKAITFFGYACIVLLSCLFIISVAYAVYSKNSFICTDKRADIGCITGLYISYLYYNHVLQMANIEEAMGGGCAIVCILLISRWFCIEQHSISETKVIHQS